MPAYESVPYDNLIAGMVQPIVTQSIIIEPAAGAVYERGAVMTRTGFASDGTWICKIVDAADTAPAGVLADELVNAITTQQRATVYTQGEFNRDALIFGGAVTITDLEAALNDAKIYTKRVVK